MMGIKRHKNIYLIGPMGAGKTTIGKLLAKKLDREFIDCDQEIINKTGASIDLIFEIEGESGFRKRENELLEEISKFSDKVISTGGGIILNPKNRSLLKNSGYVIYLKASSELLYSRTQHDRTRPLLDTNDRRAKIEQLLEIREPFYKDTADLTINTEDNTVKSIATLLSKQIVKDE